MLRRMNGGGWRALAIGLCLFAVLLPAVTAAGCGQATPEQTVYRFLGAVQAHDYGTMRSCVNPDAVAKVEEGQGELALEWEELYRKYMVEPVNWRMEFDGIALDCSYLDTSSALVRIASGRCSLYNLRDGIWVREGAIDFGKTDFLPLYLARKDGKWYLEALDLYIVFGLESTARI
jgi:hypothetical protein